MSVINERIRKYISKTTFRHASRILIGVSVVIAMSFIFAFRYQPAFTAANFYAEDGSIFVDTALKYPLLETITTGFNGYLVVGQYLISELAVGVHDVLQMPFYDLPIIIAILSCLFLGLTVSLPFLLLRREIGSYTSLTISILGAFVPLLGSDYAVIGTIGNLKFAFLYWAFIAVLYRIYNSTNIRRVILADLMLLLSLLTFAPTVALLPFIFVPYIRDGLVAVKRRDWSYFRAPQILSACALVGAAVAYIGVVYLKGIPAMPGYLDTPYNTLATIKILFRSTWYSFLHPLAATLQDAVVIGVTLLTVYIGWRRKEDRLIFGFALWSIAIGTVSFVVNRPGIGDFFLQYGKNPDQFFYAQSLIFTFSIVWLLRKVVERPQLASRILMGSILLLFVAWSYDEGSSLGKNAELYRHLGTSKQSVETACKREINKDPVVLQLYPSEQWKWTVPRAVVCDSIQE